MYLFKKKVDLYDDVIASALKVAKKCANGESVNPYNEPCSKYMLDYVN